MINLLKISFFGLSLLATTGCESLSRWKMAGTRALVSVIPREVDRHLGEAAQTTQVRALGSAVVPPEANTHVSALAAPLLKMVSLSPLEPRVQVVASDLPNAFAFPHGGIFVTTKLIQISKSPEEILSVLAHEVAHVVQRHSMQQLVTQAGMTIAISTVFGDLGALGDIASAGGTLLGLKFSRDHEREADAVGVEILRKAGLPLNGMSAFFERMDEFEKSQSKMPINENVMSFLQTHPRTEERIETARALVSEPGVQTPRAVKDAFLRLKKLF
ncbi:MAG: M48 family metallopeptidase [Silvanigrellaceae bacterium]